MVFFLPDVEYLENLDGLIKYLGEKIGTGNACIYCDKIFRSVTAVQSHMTDMHHCKLSDKEEEYEDFYDYSASYSNLKLPEGTDMTDESLFEYLKQNEVMVSEDGSELILPDGRRIGHRAFHRYYRQHLRQAKSENGKSLMLHQMVNRYRLLGWTGTTNTQQRTQIEAHKHQRDSNTRLGVKSNKLQRHFRDSTQPF